MLLTMHHISTPLINSILFGRLRFGKYPKSIDMVKKRKGLLFYEGDHLDRLFLLLEGRVTLFKADEAGEQVPVISLEKGDFVGLHALCDKGYSSHTAWIAKASRLLVIPSKRLPNMMECWPGLKQKIVSQLICHTDRLELTMAL